MLLFVALPIQPTDLIVLTIGVVISLLGATELIAAQKHRHALGQKEHRQKIALLPPAQTVDVRIVGRTLDAAIPGTVVIVSVAIFVAVRFVVLVVVTDKVVEGEAVVRSDEIDAGVGLAAVV